MDLLLSTSPLFPPTPNLSPTLNRDGSPTLGFPFVEKPSPNTLSRNPSPGLDSGEEEHSHFLRIQKEWLTIRPQNNTRYPTLVTLVTKCSHQNFQICQISHERRWPADLADLDLGEYRSGC
jgi:hypothetical protein